MPFGFIPDLAFGFAGIPNSRGNFDFFGLDAVSEGADRR
jgi:hypothetical protein